MLLRFSRLKAPRDAWLSPYSSRTVNRATTTTPPIIRSDPEQVFSTSDTGSGPEEATTTSPITITTTSRPSTRLTWGCWTRRWTTWTVWQRRQKWRRPSAGHFRPSCIWAMAGIGICKIPLSRACAPTCNTERPGDCPHSRNVFLFIVI